MEIIDKTIKSKYQPKQTNVTWIDISGETPVEKQFINGKWVAVSGSSGGNDIVINPDEEATKTLYKIKADGTVYDADISGKADKVNTPQIFFATAINALTDEQCREIKSGDIVVVSNNGANYTCTVTTKTSNTLYMYYMYGDTKTLFRIKYQKTNGTWSFNKQYIIDLETPQKTVMPQSGGMNSNTLYVLGELNSDTTFVLSPVGDNTIANVWTWTFSTGSTAPTITWPAQITMWSNGEAPTIEANKYYEVSVMNGVGTVISADIPQEEENEVEP